MAPVDLNDATKNYLKAVLVLKHLKSGLLPFIDNKISTFHNNLKTTHGTCNLCTTENILKCPTRNVCSKNRHGICQHHDNGNPLKQSRPCPTGVCDNIREAIIREHIKGEPSWKNTDATKWSSDAWEVAKCFLPPGSSQTTSSADTDCTGLLTLCLLCLPVTTLVVRVKGDIEKNRDNRNVLMHSGRQELSDADRSSFIQDAIRLLATFQTPISMHTQDCIDTLNQIDTDGLVLTTDDIVAVIEDKVDAIRMQQKKLEADVQGTVTHVAENTNAIENQNTKLDSYKRGVQQLDDDLKAMHSTILRLDVTDDVSKLQKDMENIRHNNEGICKDINQKIEALEAKVKTLEAQMVTIDNTNEARHKEYDTRLKECDTTFKEHDDRLQEYDKRQKELEQRVEKQEAAAKDAKIDHNVETIYSRMPETDDNEQVLLTHQSPESNKSTDNKTRMDAEMMPLVNRPNVQTMQGRIRLRDYLIKKYKTNYSDVPVAPPKNDMWTDIKTHYREQDMKQVSMPGESQIDHGEKETDATVTSYKDIFYRNDKKCHNVYVKGDAGSGKSMFCQRMVTKWCDVHSSDKKEHSSNEVVTSTKEQNDRDMLHQFEYLFYITLRHATHQFDVETMIKGNVLRNNKIISVQLTDILENESENCLVLIDGLDEWSPPDGSPMSPFVTFGLPDRDDSLDWTVLTTTRPWKLETIRPKRHEMDQLIELSGLTKYSVKETIHSVVDYLKIRYSKNASAKECERHLYGKDLRYIMTLPILLKHLVCIWFENGSVGKTKCDLYASMVHLFLKYADLKTNQYTLCDFIGGNPECNYIPACLKRYESCRNLEQPLFKLSKLAFHTLFNKDRTSSLVFDSRTTTIHGMCNAEVRLWLDIGILSQDSVDTRCTEDEKMMSFPHKTIQEFLAAVYIVMHADTDTVVLPVVKETCKSVDMVHDMSQVFVFLAGMTPAIFTTISRYISQVVSADPDVQHYRSIGVSQRFPTRCVGISRGESHVRAIQQLMNRCITETIDTGLKHIEIHIQDIVVYLGDINISTSKSFVNCITFNASYIKSFRIRVTEPLILPFGSQFSTFLWRALQKDMGDLQCFAKLEHLVVSMYDGFNYDDIDGLVVPIIRTSMHTLTFISLSNMSFKQSISRELLACPCVQGVQFERIVFCIHDIEHVQTLQRLYLSEITCNHCSGHCRLDLSRLTKMKSLYLDKFCVSSVQINTSQLEECSMFGLQPPNSMNNQEISTHISLGVHGDSRHLQTLHLNNIELSHEQLLLFVTRATQLQKLILNDINCRDCCTACIYQINLSQHTQLKELKLNTLHVSVLHINITQMKTCIIDNSRSTSDLLSERSRLRSSSNVPGPCDVSISFHGEGQRLERLILTNMVPVLKHEQLERLLLSNATQQLLQELSLCNIKCSDCCNNCTFSLDLSRHSQLKELRLECLVISRVHINITQMQMCKLVNLKSARCMTDKPGSADTALIFSGHIQKLPVLVLRNIKLKHDALEGLVSSVGVAATYSISNLRCVDCVGACAAINALLKPDADV